MLHLSSQPRPALRLLDTALDWLRALEALEILREGERRDALLETGGWLGLAWPAPEWIKVDLSGRESLSQGLAGEEEEVGHDGSALAVLESLKGQGRQLLIF